MATIKDLLADIEYGRMILPEFQRDMSGNKNRLMNL
jgi:hypothetical protein